MLRVLLIFIFSFQIFFYGCSQKVVPDKFSKTIILMDTFVQIIIYDEPDSFEKVSGILEEVISEGKSLEKKLSNFDIGSEINKLNLTKKGIVSPELFEVLSIAKQISRVTDGGFDVTVSPILKKNGFYSDMPETILQKIPDDIEKIGFENIVIDNETREIELLNDVWVDSSGISKGYIVDKLTEIFLSKEIEKFLINAGGDIYCNYPGNNKGWVIGIQSPKNNNISLVVKISRKAIATSGDYENVVVENETERLLSHIVNPSEKTVLEERQVSFTVIADTCARADALATGMMAMGTEKAIALANRIENVELIIVNGEMDDIIFSNGAEKNIYNAKSVEL